MGRATARPIGNVSLRRHRRIRLARERNGAAGSVDFISRCQTALLVPAARRARAL